MQKWDYNYLFPIRCYLDSEGHETTKKMRFVDMCIEVDSHIPHWNEKTSEGNWVVDKDREFNLIYSLCLMLASKGKMCSDGREYDDFAFFLAYDVFDKIERPRNIETPIKSVLNYIKSILYWRYIQFKDKDRQQILDPVYNKRWGDGTLKNSIIDRMEASKKDLTVEDVRNIIDSFPKIVYKHIPKKFKDNKIISKYIYISSCLTMIKLFGSSVSKKIPTAIFNKNYDVILYRLDTEYSDVVKVVMNKSLLSLADNIKETIDKFKVGDYEYEILMNSVFGSVNTNEDYYTLD